MTVRPLVFTAACILANTGCALPFLSASATQDPARIDNSAPSTAAAAVQIGESAPPAAAAAVTSMPRAIEPDAFRIGPEDILDVQVWKNADLSRIVPVRPDGMISLPLVNDIQAAGLTASELRLQVTQRLAEFLPSPEVSVIVREIHSPKAAVIGNVRMPGHYEMKSPTTVLELIARAQGLTEFADRGRIVVLRQNGTTTTRIPFNYRKVAEGSEQDNFSVRPGDIIVVP